MAVGAGGVVEYAGRLFQARQTTTREPALDTADWALDADVPH